MFSQPFQVNKDKLRFVQTQQKYIKKIKRKKKEEDKLRPKMN